MKSMSNRRESRWGAAGSRINDFGPYLIQRLRLVGKETAERDRDESGGGFHERICPLQRLA